jgi:murein DD-endopeptidase MepM/ murein hydrolase activator NlpD
MTRRVLTTGFLAALVAALWAATTLPDTARADDSGQAVAYALPLPDGTAVVHPFEAPPQPWAAGHRGVDLTAIVGATVRAPAAGVVAFAGSVAGRGVVTIVHADGLRSSLEPVSATVAVGDRVDAGAPIGTVSAETSHCAPDACVHWGVRRGLDYLDPLLLLPGAGPIVLLPLDDGAWP